MHELCSGKAYERLLQKTKTQFLVVSRSLCMNYAVVSLRKTITEDKNKSNINEPESALKPSVFSVDKKGVKSLIFVTILIW